jgi:hypothetical protein
MRTDTLDVVAKSMNSKLGVYLAEKMQMISYKLNRHDFRIVFCCHLAFLVLAYIPMPKGRGFTLDLDNVDSGREPSGTERW